MKCLAKLGLEALQRKKKSMAKVTGRVRYTSNRYIWHRKRGQLWTRRRYRPCSTGTGSDWSCRTHLCDAGFCMGQCMGMVAHDERTADTTQTAHSA